MDFKIFVHKEPEGGFWAEVPAIVGCASQGGTMEELLANIREAILGCLEDIDDSITLAEAIDTAVEFSSWEDFVREIGLDYE